MDRLVQVVLDSRWVLYFAYTAGIVAVGLVFTVVRKTWTGISAGLALISALSWFAYTGLLDYWVFNRPNAPNVQKEQTVQREQHGSFYYISEDEELLAECLSRLALVGVTAAVSILGVSELRRRRFPPKT